MHIAKIPSLILVTVLGAIMWSQIAVAHWDSARPDAHAPIGVMADHTHESGEWMFSYRAMLMTMEGNRDGTEHISTRQVHSQFPVAPLKMDMEMHMLGVMYAPSDDLTLSLMVPYLKNSMDHITRMGAEFETIGEGLGDIKVGAIFSAGEWQAQSTQHRLLALMGLELPTGDDAIRDDTIMPNVKLPYPMQVGSGTYNLLPGMTYLGQQIGGRYSWGAQLRAVIHTGHNDEGYRRGDNLQLTSWLARQMYEHLSLSIRLTAQSWQGIEGRDDELNSAMVQTANPSLLSGRRVDISLGMNIKVPGTGHRVALEVGRAVWQNLNGPQLETDIIITFGWQWAI